MSTAMLSGSDLWIAGLVSDVFELDTYHLTNWHLNIHFLEWYWGIWQHATNKNLVATDNNLDATGIIEKNMAINTLSKFLEKFLVLLNQKIIKNTVLACWDTDRNSHGQNSLVDGADLRTFFCNPLQTSPFSGFRLGRPYANLDRKCPSPLTLSRIQIHKFRPMCTSLQKRLF